MEIPAAAGLIAPLFHILGLFHSIHAVMHVRTSRGAIAWAIALVTFPYLAIPLYWICGRSRFSGYVEAHRAGNRKIREIALRAREAMSRHSVRGADRPAGLDFYEHIVGLPCTRGNAAHLLIDGPDTFRAMLDAIAAARKYVLIEFFIVHGDKLGNAFKEAVIAKAREGVRIYFIYDEIGSNRLPRSYVSELHAAGVQARAFGSSRGWRGRFQINFRNHRKITIVDGEVAFVGGLNIGDEYMGWSSRFGHWRDTHLKLGGPAVLGIQLAFLEDWYWAGQTVPDLSWDAHPAPEHDQITLVLPCGPADEFQTCELFYLEVIQSAKERIWITSPYFVPDLPVARELQLAALRGVDVRIMLPDKPDHLLVYLSTFTYIPDMIKAGAKLYRYEKGFLHEKVLLVDRERAAVGTANLDNRSFYLNFEILVVQYDESFTRDVEKMLLKDFANCRAVTAVDFEGKPFWFRLAARVARLLSPLQ